jgi:adenine-specific DNA-methyltransferase
MATDKKDRPESKAKLPPEPHPSGTYDHSDQAVQRPAVGVQQEFPDRRPAKDYRYDSSLAPELCWDENAERDLAESAGLLNRDRAGGSSHRGEAPRCSPRNQVWAGTGEPFDLPAPSAWRDSNPSPSPSSTGRARPSGPGYGCPPFPSSSTSACPPRRSSAPWRPTRPVGTTGDLFGDPGLDISDQLDSYEHLGPWNNRLILGDSLQVMNSLLEYEGLGGQVQMIYMDPPLWGEISAPTFSPSCASAT